MKVDSHYGAIVRENAALIMKKTGNALKHVELVKGKPMYQVEAATVSELLEQYKSDIVDELPRSVLTKQKAKISRFDHAPDDKKSAFNDATGTAGLMHAQIKQANAVNHMAIIRVRMEIIDPNVVGQL